MNIYIPHPSIQLLPVYNLIYRDLIFASIGDIKYFKVPCELCYINIKNIEGKVHYHRLFNWSNLSLFLYNDSLQSTYSISKNYSLFINSTIHKLGNYFFFVLLEIWPIVK